VSVSTDAGCAGVTTTFGAVPEKPQSYSKFVTCQRAQEPHSPSTRTCRRAHEESRHKDLAEATSPVVDADPCSSAFLSVSFMSEGVNDL